MRGPRISEESPNTEDSRIHSTTINRRQSTGNLPVLTLGAGFKSPLIMKGFVLNLLRSGFCTIACFVTVLFNLHTSYRRAIMSIMAVRKKGKVSFSSA